MTKPLTFAGEELVINYSTSVVGGLKIEVQTHEGVPVEGFTIEDCEEIYGDEIERIVRWKGGPITKFEAQPIRLRFVMTKEVDLYSLQFRRTPYTGETQ